jgi:hypothetical protein
VTHRVLALALLVVVSAPLQSQSTALTQALRAYQRLDFDLAATLLRRALSGELSDSTQIQALTYLGAAEHYRARADSAAVVWRRLVVLAPGYQPDTLVFPPEITRSYNDARRRMRVEMPRLSQIPRRIALRGTATQPPTPPPPPPPPAPRDSRDVPPEQGPRGVTATAAALVLNIRARSEAGGLPPATGTVLGMTASVRLRRFELGVRYMEGSLQTRDLVEGAAVLRFATTPWLTVHAGPQIRRYDLAGGAERWVTWQFGARTEAPIVGTSVRGHALLWQGLGLSVNVPPGSGTARGGEVGVTIAPSPRPFWFGLAYGIDQASVTGSSRRETVETFTVSAGLRKP